MDRAVCTKVSGLIGPFLDGELDAASVVEVDDHLACCSTCREQVMFSRALKVSVKRAVAQRAPDALRARIEAALAAERANAPAEIVAAEIVPAQTAMVAPVRELPQRPWLKRAGNVARTWLPVSAAAAALLFAWSQKRAQQHEARVIPRGVLGDLVAQHSRPLPPERTEPGEVRALERYVGVPVKLPFRSSTKAKLVGGRIMPVQN